MPSASSASAKMGLRTQAIPGKQRPRVVSRRHGRLLRLLQVASHLARVDTARGPCQATFCASQDLLKGGSLKATQPRTAGSERSGLPFGLSSTHATGKALISEALVLYFKLSGPTLPGRRVLRARRLRRCALREQCGVGGCGAFILLVSAALQVLMMEAPTSSSEGDASGTGRGIVPPPPGCARGPGAVAPPCCAATKVPEGGRGCPGPSSAATLGRRRCADLVRPAGGDPRQFSG